MADFEISGSAENLNITISGNTSSETFENTVSTPSPIINLGNPPLTFDNENTSILLDAISSTAPVQTIKVVTNGGFILPSGTGVDISLQPNMTDIPEPDTFPEAVNTTTLEFSESDYSFPSPKTMLIPESNSNSFALPNTDLISDSTNLTDQSIADFIRTTIAPEVEFTNNSTLPPNISIFRQNYEGPVNDTSLWNFEQTLLSTLKPLINETMDNEFVHPENEESTMMSPAALICTVLPLSLISLVIIFGNLLVIVAVFTQRRLKTPQNIYIVSLAIADMTVGVLILPINIAFLVLDRWFMGYIMCELWLVTDVSLCTVSIFHLCAIAVDRYRAITDGINYVQKRNLKAVLWTILFIWILAFWIGSPPILGWKDVMPDGSPEPYVEGECMLPTNVGYVFHLALGALFFPLIVMGFIYLKIFFAIRERFREKSKVHCMDMSEHSSTDAPTSSVGNTLKRGTVNGRKPSEQISSFIASKQKFSLSRERKAARTLGIIMGAFMICWLPLGFLNIYTALVPEEYGPSVAVFQVFNWLGYVNSGLNPIIYAISNQEFQKAFRRLLHLDY